MEGNTPVLRPPRDSTHSHTHLDLHLITSSCTLENLGVGAKLMLDLRAFAHSVFAPRHFNLPAGRRHLNLDREATVRGQDF